MVKMGEHFMPEKAKIIMVIVHAVYANVCVCVCVCVCVSVCMYLCV